jgi:hypothetical protein
MSNLNTHIAALLTEVKKNQMRNERFANSSFPAIHAELETAQDACTLSEDELAASHVTIERINLESQINKYIHTARHSYNAIQSNNETPAWLLRNGTTPEIFTEFFNNISSVNDNKFFAGIELYIAVTLPQVQELYQHWQELKSKKHLKQEAIDKIQHAYDLRILLESILRYFGYPGSEIDEMKG